MEASVAMYILSKNILKVIMYFFHNAKYNILISTYKPDFLSRNQTLSNDANFFFKNYHISLFHLHSHYYFVSINNESNLFPPPFLCVNKFIVMYNNT